MRADDFIKAHLARICWADAGMEGLNGMLAVAFTIRNRIRAGWQNGDWISILAHHNEYAAVEGIYTNELPDPRNHAFSIFLQEIDGIFAGTKEDDITRPNQENMGPIIRFDTSEPNPVALYYAHLYDPNLRPWFLTNISQNTEKHRQIASVGTLTFFS